MISDRFPLLATHADFRACLEWLEHAFQPGLLPEAVPETDSILKLVGNRDSAFSIAAQSKRDPQWRRLKRKPEMKRFVAVVKASLLAADVPGSWSGQREASGDGGVDDQPEPLELVESGLAAKPSRSRLRWRRCLWICRPRRCWSRTSARSRA